jgi:hypothetical protein
MMPLPIFLCLMQTAATFLMSVRGPKLTCQWHLANVG